MADESIVLGPGKLYVSMDDGDELEFDVVDLSVVYDVERLEHHSGGSRSPDRVVEINREMVVHAKSATCTGCKIEHRLVPVTKSKIRVVRFGGKNGRKLSR